MKKLLFLSFFIPVMAFHVEAAYTEGKTNTAAFAEYSKASINSTPE